MNRSGKDFVQPVYVKTLTFKALIYVFEIFFGVNLYFSSISFLNSGRISIAAYVKAEFFRPDLVTLKRLFKIFKILKKEQKKEKRK